MNVVLARNFRHNGPNREGALFCRTGTWLEVLDKRTAEYEAKLYDLARPEYVRGTRLENSRFSMFLCFFHHSAYLKKKYCSNVKEFYLKCSQCKRFSNLMFQNNFNQNQKLKIK